MVENAKRSLLVFGLIIMLMLISCISAQAATDFNTDKSIMADRCNTDYGYKDIVSNIKSDKMAKLYKAIDSVEKDFFVNNRNATKLSDSQYCIKTMDVSKYGLSDDQVIQVYNIYSYDHPLYFWIDPTSISASSSSLVLECLPEFANASNRNTEYSKICDGIREYVDYCGSNKTNYIYSTAVMLLMSQNVEYAFMDDGQPELAAWAHSIVGVLDKNYYKAVCEGYAKSYQLLMNYFGVPNVYVVGSANGSISDTGELVLHAWNIVKMDNGKYYYSDVTWSDSSMDTGDTEAIEDIRSVGVEYVSFSNPSDHLKGCVFETNHWASTPDNAGSFYLYPLPEVSDTDYGQDELLTDDSGNWLFQVNEDNESHRFAYIFSLTEKKRREIYNSDGFTYPTTINYSGKQYRVIGVDLESIDVNSKSVTIPEGIIIIGGGRKYYPTVDNNTELSYISIPASVRYIMVPDFPCFNVGEFRVASGNPYITSVDGILYNKKRTTLIRYPSSKKQSSFTIPSSVTRIYSMSFSDNKNLKTITVPDSVKRFDDAAFDRAQSIEKLSLPSSVTYLGSYLFAGSSLQEISIPAATYFEPTFLNDALQLVKVSIASGNKNGFVYNGAVYVNHLIDGLGHDYGLSLIRYIPKRTADTVTVKPGCYIEGSSFYGTEHIGKVVIPKDCTVCQYAFLNSGIEELQVDKNNTSIRYSNGAVLSSDGSSLYTYLAGHKSTSYSIPSTVKAIGKYAFSGSRYLQNLTMTDSVKTIGENAFKDCLSIKSVHLSDAIDWKTDWKPGGIVSYMLSFSGCENLETINIPKSATHIPSYTFENCKSLRNITIPNNIQSIGAYAFNGCDNLEKITVENSSIHLPNQSDQNQVSSWCEVFSRFWGCSENWNGDCARVLLYCDPSCDIATYLNSEEYQQFRPDQSEVWVVDKKTDVSKLPNNGTCGDQIKWSVSSDGKTLTLSGSGDMTDYNGTVPPPWYLKYSSTIEHIKIGKGIKSIGHSAFLGFTSLKDVSIPASLTTVNPYAFFNCKALTTVDYAGTEDLWSTVEINTGWTGKDNDSMLNANFKFGNQDYRGNVLFSDVPSGKWFTDAVYYAADKGYMAGVGNNRFNPNGTVTRATIVQILYAIEEKPSVSRSGSFKDVPKGKWYTNAVNWAAEFDIVAGYEDGTFKPDKAVSRQELATILYSYTAKLGSGTYGNADIEKYPDYKSVKKYAVPSMQWAVGNKLISGTNKGLEPSATATRAQIAVILKAYDKNLLKAG